MVFCLGLLQCPHIAWQWSPSVFAVSQTAFAAPPLELCSFDGAASILSWHLGATPPNVPSGSALLGSVHVSSHHWSAACTFMFHTLSRFRHHHRCVLARGLSHEVHVLLNTRCHRSPLCESLPEFMRVALPESPFHTTHHGTRRRTKTLNQVARKHKKKRMTMMMKCQVSSVGIQSEK